MDFYSHKVDSRVSARRSWTRIRGLMNRDVSLSRKIRLKLYGRANSPISRESSPAWYSIRSQNRGRTDGRDKRPTRRNTIMISVPSVLKGRTDGRTNGQTEVGGAFSRRFNYASDTHTQHLRRHLSVRLHWCFPDQRPSADSAASTN